MAAQAAIKRASYVPKSETEQLKFLENLHASMLGYSSRWTKDWGKMAEVYRGNNWNAKKEGNPFFKVNLARSKLDRKSARMTAGKPIINVLPHRSGLTEAAKVLGRTVNALWDACGMQMRIEMMSAFVRPFGCGFLKTVWDPRARNGMGDVVCAEIDPRRVALDPYALRSYDIDRGLAICHETTVPYSWVAENYPDRAGEVDDFDAPPPVPDDRESEYGKLSGGPVRSPLRYYLGPMRSGPQPGKGGPLPYCRIREFWYADPKQEDGRPLYPNGRVTYVVGSGRKAVILNPDVEESRNPFFDGMYPFDMYDARGDIDHPYGASQVEDVRRLEEAINRSGHMAMRMLIQNVPFIIAEAGSLTPDVVKQLQDAGYIVINKMRGLDVNRQQPQQFITEAIQLMNRTDQFMDASIGLGGGSGAVGGKGRVEVRSPDLLFGLQQDESDLINAEARRLEAMLQRVGQKLISRVFQYYRADRFIPYVSGQGWQNYLFEVKALRGEIMSMALDSVTGRLIAIDEEASEKTQKNTAETNFDLVRLAVDEAIRGAWKEFDFTIVPLSSLQATRAARTKALGEFAEMGMMPFSRVLEEAGFPDFEDLIKQRAEEQKLLTAMGLLPAPGEGGPKKKKK